MAETNESVTINAEVIATWEREQSELTAKIAPLKVEHAALARKIEAAKWLLAHVDEQEEQSQ